MARLRITLVRSSAGRHQNQRDTVRSLGLRKLHQTVEHDDSPTVRGMIRCVEHLVRVEEA